MKIEAINAVLEAEQPGILIVQSYDVRGRRLVVAFTCDGGPHENDAFVLEFEEAVLFHLPSVLYEPVRLRRASQDEARALVPAVSYDRRELSGPGGGFTVLVLESDKGKGYGYYLAAESVSSGWVPWGECREVW